MYPAVAAVEPTSDYRLILTFDTGERRVFDVRPLLTVGRFASLTSPGAFARVRVAFDTVEWENGLDLDPEYLHAHSQP